MTRRRTTMKRGGGMWDSLSSAWNTTKKEASGAYNSAASAISPTPAPTSILAPAPAPASTYTPVLGGKRRRKSKRGGYSANTPTSGLASSAASFSGKTAQPHSMVGGKTRRRRHSHSKSCKHRRSRKH